MPLFYILILKEKHLSRFLEREKEGHKTTKKMADFGEMVCAHGSWGDKFAFCLFLCWCGRLGL